MRIGHQVGKEDGELRELLIQIEHRWSDTFGTQFPTSWLRNVLKERLVKLTDSFLDNAVGHLNAKSVMTFLEVLDGSNGNGQIKKEETIQEPVSRKRGRPRKVSGVVPESSHPAI